MIAAAPPPIVIDGDGRVLRLGRKLGQGGEGVVFELEGEPGVAAKIHHRPLTRLHAEKIRVMAGMRTDQLGRLAAWPTNLLSLPSGVPVGLTMPRVTDHKDIHHLYSPKSRRAGFADADWRFLIRVAANLGRAVATIHDAQGVIADINHRGVLVARDARVRLIDCDSFQIAGGGKTYLCDVGMPTFTPPELQGLVFSEIIRTPNHDNFGLAVLIFLTLFMGRHPFAGRYIGLGEMPIERAINEGRFAYGADCAAFQMERPPGAASLAIVSPAIAGLFERAFARESKDGGRPTAREWTAELEALAGRLTQCAFGPAHWHFDGLQDCPWCRMEAATGVALFSTSVAPGATARFDIDGLWRQVMALPHPGPAPTLEAADPQHKLRPSAEALQFDRRRSMHRLCVLLLAAGPITVAFLVNLPVAARLLFLVASIGLYLVGRVLVRSSNDTAVFRDQMRKDLKHLEKVREEWRSTADPQRFDAKRAELDLLRRRWEESRDVGRRVRQERQDGELNAALARFLDGFKIEASDVPGLNQGRVPLLESFGIETAADIVAEKLDGVPKLDKKMREVLNDWRNTLEDQFRRGVGDAPISPDEELIGREALAEQLRIEAALRVGFQDLRDLEKHILFARASMQAGVEEAYRAYRQSKADLDLVKR
jgi:DNA-binding helix-hairpin-helix protein with protein kinase domain